MEKTIALLRIVDGEKLLRTDALLHPFSTDQIDVIRWDVHMQVEADEEARLPMNHKVWTTLVRRLLLTIDEQQGRIVRATQELS
jgi:hypothetical protein